MCSGPLSTPRSQSKPARRCAPTRPLPPPAYAVSCLFLSPSRENNRSPITPPSSNRGAANTLLYRFLCRAPPHLPCFPFLSFPFLPSIGWLVVLSLHESRQNEPTKQSRRWRHRRCITGILRPSLMYSWWSYIPDGRGGVSQGRGTHTKNRDSISSSTKHAVGVDNERGCLLAGRRTAATERATRCLGKHLHGGIGDLKKKREGEGWLAGWPAFTASNRPAFPWASSNTMLTWYTYVPRD